MAHELTALVLGAGDMAGKHGAAYQACGVEISAVATRSDARGIAFQERFSVPERYTDYREAIRSSSADIVSICVPTFLHADLAVEALESGKHVITEKPIALTIEDAERMTAVAEKTGRKLSVVFNRRFNSVWNELQRRIGDVGRPIVYNAQEVRSIRPKLAMHTKSQNGGPVIDCCVHDFDMILNTIDETPVSVYATGRAFGSDKPQLASIHDVAVDTAHITVEFSGGSTAYLLYAWGFPVGNAYWQYREFMGPQGIVRLLGEYGETVHHHRADGKLESVSGFRDNGHEEIIARFVDAARTDSQVPVLAREAIEALRIALAAIRSIESGEKETV
jgi:predicted dehydrogenase